MKDCFGRETTNPNPDYIPPGCDKKDVTNYDYIIGLNIYELAEVIYRLTEDYDKCSLCEYASTDKCDSHVCIAGLIKYLNNPHKHGDRGLL